MSLRSSSRRRILGAGLLLLVPMHASASSPPAVVHRLHADAPGDTQFWNLPEGVVVLAQGAAAAPALRDAFVAAQGQAAGSRRFARAAALRAVSIGPVLDAPDRVELREVRLAHDPLMLHVSYTRVRRAGAELRQNRPWRPLLVVALPAGSLAPGSHELRAAWQEVDTGNESFVQSCRFVIEG